LYTEHPLCLFLKRTTLEQSRASFAGFDSNYGCKKISFKIVGNFVSLKMASFKFARAHQNFFPEKSYHAILPSIK
jgi:hypothetical protein